MHSIDGSSGQEWRNQLCKLLPSGCDLVNEDEVRQLFADGVRSADEKGIPHKKDADHYANQYLRSLRQGDDPIIPRFMRLYCAEINGLRLAEDQPIGPVPSHGAKAKPLASLDSKTKPPKGPILRQPALARG